MKLSPWVQIGHSLCKLVFEGLLKRMPALHFEFPIKALCEVYYSYMYNFSAVLKCSGHIKLAFDCILLLIVISG